MFSVLAATGNPHKKREWEEFLRNFSLVEVCFKSPSREILVEERGETFFQNAYLKGYAYFKEYGGWVLAEDAGLVIPAIGGKPGVYSSRYGKTDEERIQRVLKEMEGKKDRFSYFLSVFCFFLPDGSYQFFVGKVEGEILYEPRGKEGFGYDPIFYYPPIKKSFAELAPQEKIQYSHRGRALKKWAEFVKRYSQALSKFSG